MKPLKMEDLPVGTEADERLKHERQEVRNILLKINEQAHEIWELNKIEIFYPPGYSRYDSLQQKLREKRYTLMQWLDMLEVWTHTYNHSLIELKDAPREVTADWTTLPNDDDHILVELLEVFEQGDWY